jgi:hypothetical protein
MCDRYKAYKDSGASGCHCTRAVTKKERGCSLMLARDSSNNEAALPQPCSVGQCRKRVGKVGEQKCMSLLMRSRDLTARLFEIERQELGG